MAQKECFHSSLEQFRFICLPNQSLNVLCSGLALLRYALLGTNGAPEVLATIQVFTLCFVEALKKENNQVCYIAYIIHFSKGKKDFSGYLANHRKEHLIFSSFDRLFCSRRKFPNACSSKGNTILIESIQK